jgi:hypothetical protein
MSRMALGRREHAVERVIEHANVRNLEPLVGGVVSASLVLGAQPGLNADDAVLDVLVWGTHMPIDPQAYLIAGCALPRRTSTRSDRKMRHAADGGTRSGSPLRSGRRRR